MEPDNYSIEMAKMIGKGVSKSAGKTTTPFLIGKVAKASPLMVSVRDGQVILTKEDLYICESVLEKSFDYLIETTVFKGTATLKKDGVASGYDVLSLDIKNDAEGRITLQYTFEVGDELMLVTNDNQVYFIVDKVRKLV